MLSSLVCIFFSLPLSIYECIIDRRLYKRPITVMILFMQSINDSLDKYDTLQVDNRKHL